MPASRAFLSLFWGQGAGSGRAAPPTEHGAVVFCCAPPYMAGMKRMLPQAIVLERLRAVGLRPTRQRLALTRLLFAKGNRHVTAEQLHGEVLASAIRVSLATVYNTLHQFTEAGFARTCTG